METKRALRWLSKERQYVSIEVPLDCISYSSDMKKKVRCVECMRIFEYGDCYTSKRIHTPNGFGYAVCESCYLEEIQEEEND